MEYKPITCVWEVTMACNMRCKHCGSSCSVPDKDELTTEEAVKLCKEIGDLGLRWVTISGGEPTTRKDWDIIAKALTDNNVTPTMITNGWLLDNSLIERAEKAGINTLAISIDGTEETHDFIRRKGAFKKALAGLDLIRNSKIHSAVITTINSKNITELEDLKNILIENGVEKWQIQIGLPMGNLSHNKGLVASPDMVNKVIDFAYDVIEKGEKIEIDLADCIGYFNSKEAAVRATVTHNAAYNWTGCGAGKYNFGILNNGDILGCTSIRDREFIEGNIKEKSLREIWEDKNAFKWNRDMSKDKLKGKCEKCMYGDICKGGCSNTRLTMNGSIYSENKYCSYNLALVKAENSLNRIDDASELIERADFFINHKNYQLAEISLSLALKKDKDNIDILNKLGFVNYQLGNYKLAKEANEAVLNLDSKNCYASKGLGLSLIKLKEIDTGLDYLHKSIDLIDGSYLDPYYDLAITLLELDKKDEAIKIIETATNKYPNFKDLRDKFYAAINAECEPI